MSAYSRLEHRQKLTTRKGREAWQTFRRRLYPHPDMYPLEEEEVDDDEGEEDDDSEHNDEQMDGDVEDDE